MQLDPENFIKALKGEQFETLIGQNEQFKPQQYEDLLDVIVIDNVEVTEEIYIADKDIFEKAIVIKGGEFESNFRIQGGEFKSYFWIQGGEFKSNFLIQGGEFKSDFWIQGGEFKSYFLIQGGEFKSDFWIQGGNFQSNFRIQGGNFQSNFLILGGEFESDFWIQGGEFKSNFTIQGGEFKSDFRIWGGEFKSNFWIQGGEFKSYFLIQGGNFQSILFEQSSSLPKPYISHLTLKINTALVVKIENIRINKLTLSDTLKSGGVLFCNNQKLTHLHLERFYNLGHVFFSGVEVLDKPWQLAERKVKDFDQKAQEELKSILNSKPNLEETVYSLLFKKNGEPQYSRQESAEVAKFYDNKFSEYSTDRKKSHPYHLFYVKEGEKQEESTLIIKDSYLGKMEFKDFPFSKFKIETCHSNFTAVTTYGEDFPTKDISVMKAENQKEKEKENQKEKEKGLYELYRDLSLAKEKQKDTDGMLKFKARSNHHNARYLLRKSFVGTFPSRFSLWFSWVSSSYRRTWFLPLIWLLVFGSILYVANLWALGVENIWNGNCWKDFPIFLNPTHKFGLIKVGEYGFWANLIDVVSRIF